MKLRLLTVSHKQPTWVNEGFAEYKKRLPREWGFDLVEIKPEARTGGRTSEQGMAAEKARILAAIGKGERLIALDERGARWSTRQLADELAAWQQDGRDVSFVIGGADGLDAEVKQHADQLVSLSDLTLPHGLVRILLCEQLYRASSLLSGHPYHRD